MREKIIRFMQGRYGIDALGKFLVYLGLVFALIDLLFHSVFLTVTALAIWIFAYYRIFSRNFRKRIDENSRYLKVREALTKRFSGKSLSSGCNRYEGRVIDAEYKIFKCPKCRQKLRVPKGKGRIRITCRRCSTEFVKRS